MQTDQEFATKADAFMAKILEKLDELDPDELDPNLAMGVLSMEFADGSKCIMNRQTAAHQIWLAHGATAWHFEWDDARGAWMDTKGRGRIEECLAGELEKKLGRPVALT